MSRRTTIMLTSFNDAQTLDRLIPNVKICTDDNTHILIVDDGPTDNTNEIIQRHSCESIRHDQNMGVGAAYHSGFKHILGNASSDFVIKIDADGQHRPDFIEKLIHHLKAEAAPVICSRFHPATEHMGTMLDRVILNDLFAGHLRRVTGWKITDARSGFFGLPIQVIEKITPRLITKGYGVPMEVILRAWRLNPYSTHLEIPHPAIYRGHGSIRRDKQYDIETANHKLTRFLEAFKALIAVEQDMGINAEELIRLLNAGIPFSTEK